MFTPRHPVRAKGMLAASLFLNAAAPPANAAIIAQSGEWTIVEGEINCTMAASYESGGTVALMVDLSRPSAALVLSDERWQSISEKQTVPVEIEFIPSGVRGKVNAKGSRNELGPSLYAPFELDEFAKNWRQSTSFILRYQGKMVAGYTLRGSAAAYTKTAECAARRLKVSKFDPFDPNPAPKLQPPSPKYVTSDQGSVRPAKRTYPPGSPIPILGSGPWVMTEDYPSAALREGREGVVAYALDVGTDGMPIACSITTSSGHADLDERTCTLLTRRARFEQAKDAKGNPVRAVFTGRMRWGIP